MCLVRNRGACASQRDGRDRVSFKPQRARQRVKQIRLVGDAEHVDGLRTLRRDPNFRSSVVLRLAVRPGGIVDRHRRLIALGEQRAERARSPQRLVARNGHDLAGVPMVSGDDDERVGVGLRIL